MEALPVPYRHRLAAVLVLLAAVISLTLLWLPSAYAATITVTTTADELNTDGDCSLREAIRAANTDTKVDACATGTGADTITLPAGTYTVELASFGEDAGTSGDLDFPGGVVNLRGASTAPTVIAGRGDLDRIFDIHAGAQVELATLTLQGAYLEDGSGGAGLRNAGNLVLREVVIRNNVDYSHLGGGLLNTGTAQLDHVTIAGNGGGGIANSGDMTIRDSLIDGNGMLGNGGGITNSGSMTLHRSTVRNNSASYRGGAEGGGIANRGTLAIAASTIHHNEVHGFGGEGGSGNGGGIVNEGTINMTNSTISNNTARGASQDVTDDGTGGGLFNWGGTVTLLNVTVSENVTSGGGREGSGTGSGVANFGGGTIRIANTIIAGNTGEQTGSPECFGTLTSEGYNLIRNTSGCTITGDTTGNIVNTASGLGPLQDNGGPTLTHALQPGSRAIDAGSATGCPTTDQRGVARPADGNGDGTARCDIGAYELRGTTVPTQTPTATPTATPRPTSTPIATPTGTPTPPPPVITVTGACGSSEYLGDFVRGAITIQVAGAPIRLADLTADLEGAADERVTLTPNLVGQQLPVGTTKITAVFRNITPDAGVTHFRVRVAATLNDDGHQAASSLFPVCSREDEPPTKSTRLFVPLLHH